MTFWATPSEETGYAGQSRIDVNVTYGPITIKVTEDPGHLRNFHRELGKILDETRETKAAV